jgi:hypothetical protein
MWLTCRDLRIAPVVYREDAVLRKEKCQTYVRVGKFNVSGRLTVSFTIFSVEYRDNATVKY